MVATEAEDGTQAACVVHRYDERISFLDDVGEKLRPARTSLIGPVAQFRKLEGRAPLHAPP